MAKEEKQLQEQQVIQPVEAQIKPVIHTRRLWQARLPEDWHHLQYMFGTYILLLIFYLSGKVVTFINGQPPLWLQEHLVWSVFLLNFGPVSAMIMQLLCLAVLIFWERELIRDGCLALLNGLPSLEILVGLACPLALVQGIITIVVQLKTGTGSQPGISYSLSAGVILVMLAVAAYLEKAYKVVHPEIAIKPAASEEMDITYLEQIKALVAQAREGKIPLEKMTDRIALIYVPFILVVAVIAALSWLWTGFGWLRSLEIFTVILLCGTATAAFIAVPYSVRTALNVGRRRGIWFRDVETLARTPQVVTVIFDKTGTLTEGKPAVTDVKTFKGGSERGIIAIAAAMVQDGTDPISRAFRTKAGEDALPLCTEVQRHGEGMVTARCFKENIRLGSQNFVQGFVYMPVEALDQAQAWQNMGRTVFYLSVGRTLYGMFAVSDVLREDGKSVVASLQKQGLRTVMMTGDDKRAANYMGHLAGTDQVISELMPEQKAEFVHSLQQIGEVVAMAGDWLNDAPALAQADVGIAFGSKIDAVTASSAAIILPRNDLQMVEVCLRLGKETLHIARQNLRLSLILNVLALPFAAGLGYLKGWGALPDEILVILPVISIFFLLLNTWRLRFFK